MRHLHSALCIFQWRHLNVPIVLQDCAPPARNWRWIRLHMKSFYILIINEFFNGISLAPENHEKSLERFLVESTSFAEKCYCSLTKAKTAWLNLAEQDWKEKDKSCAWQAKFPAASRLASIPPLLRPQGRWTNPAVAGRATCMSSWIGAGTMSSMGSTVAEACLPTASHLPLLAALQCFWPAGRQLGTQARPRCPDRRLQMGSRDSSPLWKH